MNLVGKIFVGIIAALSVVLFSLSLVILAKHPDWQAKAKEHKQTSNALANDAKELQSIQEAFTDELKANKTEFANVYTALQTDAKRGEQAVSIQNDTLLQKFQNNEIEMQKTVEVINVANATIGQSREMAYTLRNDLTDAQGLRAAYLRDLARTVGQKHQQASVLESLEHKNASDIDTLDRMKTVLVKHNLESDPSFYPPAPARPVKGLIETMQKDDGRLLMVSIGADDGLKSGHLLEVYRDSTYLGRVRILTTEPNRAVCQVLPEYRRGTFRIGDMVTSKLK